MRPCDNPFPLVEYNQLRHQVPRNLGGPFSKCVSGLGKRFSRCPFRRSLSTFVYIRIGSEAPKWRCRDRRAGCPSARLKQILHIRWSERGLLTALNLARELQRPPLPPPKVKHDPHSQNQFAGQLAT